MIDAFDGKTYLTAMNARTTMSAKGQVVIPKDVRDRLGLVPGELLNVTEMAGGVFLKAAPHKVGRSLDDVEAELRGLIRYEGPAVSIEDMNQTISDMAIESALRRDRASR